MSKCLRVCRYGSASGDPYPKRRARYLNFCPLFRIVRCTANEPCYRLTYVNVHYFFNLCTLSELKCVLHSNGHLHPRSLLVEFTTYTISPNLIPSVYSIFADLSRPATMSYGGYQRYPLSSQVPPDLAHALERLSPGVPLAYHGT